VIRAVLWDADGVLQHSPIGWEERVGAVIGADRVPRLAEQLWAVSAEALVGEVDFGAHIESVLAAQELAAERDALLATWRDIEAVVDAHAQVARLRGRVPCYLASNQDSYRAQVMREQLRYDDLLDGFFFSCDLGAAKPDPAYFDAVVNALGLPPAEILFFDDLSANVAAARAAGLRAEVWHHEEGVEALEALLATYQL
jgi:putative hydrolase of the HAD superfamily